MRPQGMYNLVKMVYDSIDTKISSLDVHCHNDVGLALANALSGCEAGANQIHTTIDGFGERTGIPSLAETAVALSVIYGIPNEFRLHMLKDLSRTIVAYTTIETRSEERCVGKECVSTCKFRWSPYH